MFTSEFIGSDFAPTHNPEQSLARYKSAPGSFLAALLNSDNNSSSGEESEAFFSALIMTEGAGGPTPTSHSNHRIKKEDPPEPRPGGESGGGGGFIFGSYSVDGINGGSSSPAFLNGFGGMGEVGNYNNIHSSADTNGVMSSHVSFSSAPPSTTMFRPSESGQMRNRSSDIVVRGFETAYPRDSWNEDVYPRDSLKRNRNGDMRMFSEFHGLDNQNTVENRKGSSDGLVHHLSLPKTSTKMADVEKFLQFQNETVPCQVRAKRGCATHPRSIAERVRRTRISEKMKKLQDLFPNMDKQTSTADMLDLAVKYIKDLQKQVETLADMKTRCICSGKTQQHGSVI